MVARSRLDMHHTQIKDRIEQVRNPHKEKSKVCIDRHHVESVRVQATGDWWHGFGSGQ